MCVLFVGRLLNPAGSVN